MKYRRNEIMETQERKLRTNLDTDLLKLVAIAAMLLDHIGGAFFPETPIFRWIGRLAFPLFCYCMTVGLLYTHDIRRYLGRLAIFAVVSQPFWILAFNADDILGNLTNWNIFFTPLPQPAGHVGADHPALVALCAGGSGAGLRKL